MVRIRHTGPKGGAPLARGGSAGDTPCHVVAFPKTSGSRPRTPPARCGRGGCAARGARPRRERERGGGVDVGPHQVGADDGHRGDPGGGARRCGRRRCGRRGGRVRRWRRRRRGPGRRRRRAAGRAGPRCRSARRGHPCAWCGRPCRRPRRGSSRSAGRASSPRAARSTAHPLTTPLGSRTVCPSGPRRRTSKTPPDSMPRPFAEVEDLPDLRRAVDQIDLAPFEPGDRRVRTVGAEDAVGLVQDGEDVLPGRLGVGRRRRAARAARG